MVTIQATGWVSASLYERQIEELLRLGAKYRWVRCGRRRGSRGRPSLPGRQGAHADQEEERLWRKARILFLLYCVDQPLLRRQGKAAGC